MPTELEDLKVQEYELRREARLLEAELFMNDGGKDRDATATRHADVHARLARAATERRAKQAEGGAGVLRREAAPGGQMMGADTTGIDATVALRMAQVPTAIVQLFDARTPLVSVTLKNAGTKWARLRVASEVQGYSARAVETTEIRPGATATLDQLPTFFPERLCAVTELTRATLNVSVENLDGRPELERTIPIWLLARTSAYLAMEDPAKGEWVDLTRYLGAWVTPDAPSVMQLLRRAASFHRDGRIVGYQVDAAGVESQVKAVFEALKKSEIVYVNSVVSFSAAPGFSSQRIRLPREALETRSANCIDGTVLMASVLEAASLRPALVIVPGHAFLAWETQRGSGKWDFVETTMIGSHDFAAAQASARALAARQQAAAPQDPRAWRLLPVYALRTQQGVYPME